MGDVQRLCAAFGTFAFLVGTSTLVSLFFALPSVVRLKTRTASFLSNSPMDTKHNQIKGTAIKYATVQLTGRLGNQLFQYAALLGLSRKLDCVPVISASRERSLTRIFKIAELREVEVVNGRNFHSGCCEFIPLPEVDSSLTSNWTFSGYFQSWKYFANMSQTVRLSLQFDTDLLLTAKDFLTEHKSADSQALVGIHVRRGDFLKTDRTLKGHTIAGFAYLERAQQHFRNQYENVQFLVISDDKDWCFENIIGSDVIYSPFTDPGIDMVLMWLCNHMIITGGTFGWWGAWLAGGSTVYYGNYPRPGSELDKIMRREDYYPPEWIGLL